MKYKRKKYQNGGPMYSDIIGMSKDELLKAKKYIKYFKSPTSDLSLLGEPPRNIRKHLANANELESAIDRRLQDLEKGIDQAIQVGGLPKRDKGIPYTNESLANGGLINMGVELGSAGIDALLPGVGTALKSVASPIIGKALEQQQITKAVQNNIDSMNAAYNPYELKGGGRLNTPEGYSEDPRFEDHNIFADQSTFVEELKSGGWMGKARKRMEDKGTVGTFTEYCGGKVTDECIQKGLKSNNKTTRKRAAFAKAARSVAKNKAYGGDLEQMGSGGKLSDKISKLVDEGYPQKQAVAIAHSMLNKKQGGGRIDIVKTKEQAATQEGFNPVDIYSDYFDANDPIGSFLQSRDYPTPAMRQGAKNAYLKSATPKRKDQLLLKPYQSPIDTSRPIRKFGGNIDFASQDFFSYSGSKHEQGGIPVASNGLTNTSQPYAEVEGEEVMARIFNHRQKPSNYVFSKRLKV